MATITATIVNNGTVIDTITHDVTHYGPDSDMATYVDALQSWDRGFAIRGSTQELQGCLQPVHARYVATEVREALDDVFKYWASQPGEGYCVTG